MPVAYESKKLSIQDILERKDKQMEAKMQKIKQENEKLNAMILKKAMRNANAAGQVRQDVNAYGQNINMQQQAMYQQMAYQYPNVNQTAQAQQMYGMPYATPNAYNGQGGAVNYNMGNGAQGDAYGQHANGHHYDQTQNQRGPH